MSQFTTILRSHMRGMGLDEAQLARKVGVNKSTVMRWLDGSVPDFTHIIALCKVLRITPTDVAAALFPKEMEELQKSLPSRAELSQRIAADVAREEIAERLMNVDDETLQAIWVLIDRK